MTSTPTDSPDGEQTGAGRAQRSPKRAAGSAPPVGRKAALPGSAAPAEPGAGVPRPPRGAPVQTPPPVVPNPAPAEAPSSPQQGHRQVAAGKPIPGTGEADPAASCRLPASPGRGRKETPGSAPDTSALPAGPSAIAAAMSEDRGPDSLDAHVRRLCDGLGLLRYHTHDSRRSPAGYPDLTLCGPRGVLFRELKTQRGKVSAAQQEWLDALTAAGHNAAVWRPASLLSGAIAAELAGISVWRTRRGSRCVCDAYGSCPQGCPMCAVCGGEAA